MDAITKVLAFWGAVVSSFAVGWNFYRDLTRRGKLRVSCYVGGILSISEGVDQNSYLIYNITNVGKEPVLLTHIGGEKEKENFMLCPHQPLPRMLNPGEYVLEHTPDLTALGKDLKRLTAIDSLGRIWKAPRKQVRKLKKDYASGKYRKNQTQS